MTQPSKGQKCTPLPSRLRMKRSHGIPAWVDVATSPITPKRNTDFAERTRHSTKRRQSLSPVRLAPFPTKPLRTSRTQIPCSSVGQWCWKSSRKVSQSSLTPRSSKYRSGNEKPWSMPTRRRNVLGQSLNKPFGDGAARPVFARGRWWHHLEGRRRSIRPVNAQSFRTCCRRLNARIVDPKISREGRHALKPRRPPPPERGGPTIGQALFGKTHQPKRCNTSASPSRRR
jgi:hypothetical protein